MRVVNPVMMRGCAKGAGGVVRGASELGILFVGRVSERDEHAGGGEQHGRRAKRRAGDGNREGEVVDGRGGRDEGEGELACFRWEVCKVAEGKGGEVGWEVGGWVLSGRSVENTSDIERRSTWKPLRTKAWRRLRTALRSSGCSDSMWSWRKGVRTGGDVKNRGKYLKWWSSSKARA